MRHRLLIACTAASLICLAANKDQAAAAAAPAPEEPPITGPAEGAETPAETAAVGENGDAPEGAAHLHDEPAGDAPDHGYAGDVANRLIAQIREIARHDLANPDMVIQLNALADEGESALKRG